MTNKSDKLIGVTEAAKLLGVHPLTVRNWADKGHIPFFRTPGGHRRFRRGALVAFQSEMSHGTPESALETAARLAVQSAIAAQRDAAQRDAAQKITVHKAQPEPWQTDMTDHQRDAMRSIGRNLLGLVIQYAAGNADETVLNQGRDIGRRYGKFARQKAMSVSETVSMFNFFRDTIIDVTFESPSADLSASSPQLYKRLNHFMNEVLVATVQAVEGTL